MGDIGLPIYGYKDKWSDDIPLMSFVPNSRTAAAIGHLFLDFIEAAGGSLFYWIFVPLLQAKLDKFRLWWNHHRVRVQIEKNIPTGHVPADAFAHPKNFGGIDCRISVPPAVDDVRQMLTEEVGSRGSHLSWFTLEFAGLAEQVYLHIGKPTLSLETAWGVFQQMAQPIADVIEL
ncbi:hypothetical protein R3P38DRAFT_3327246 [Favolaschia claudopus]|uniref:Uncharacterized protein n=1 Tax=Favolaschia claudopus TaxID=2862362 RepID=A0AAW0A552_9AGAR